MSHRRAASIVLILLVMSAIAPSGAVAQNESENVTLGDSRYTNESFGNTGDTLGNESAGNLSEGNSSDDDGGLLGGTFNPFSWMNGVLEWALNMGTGAVTAGLTHLNSAISNVPAPGSHDNPSSWTNPQNGWWPGIYEMTLWTTGLGVVFVGGAATMAFRHNDPYLRRQKLRQAGVALVMIILTWQVAPFALHFGAQASAAFTPPADHLLSTPNGLGKLLSGGILALILLYGYIGIVVVGLFAIVAQFVLLHMCVAFWPVAWGCKAFGDGTIANLGNFNIWLFGLLIGVNIVQAMFLRLLYLLPWEAGLAGPVFALLGTIVGIGFVAVYLPWSALKTADQAASVGLGMSSMNRHKGKKHARAASERVGEVKAKVEKWRGANTDTNTKTTASASGAPPSTDSTGVSSPSSVSRKRSIGQMGSANQDSTGRYSSTDRSRESFEQNRGFQ